MIDEVLDEQARYYAARAGEYDDWWHRRGRYDRGEEATARWRAEATEVEEALASCLPEGHVLELACGTGLWTRHVISRAARVTALDAAPEVLELARARLASEVRDGRVAFEAADLFTWRPRRRYDAVVFTFWLSHVPEDRFDDFWARVAEALAPGARVFLVDSRRTVRSTSVDHVLPGPGEETMVRRLDDGREFRIVKRFHEPDELTARLASIGWRAALSATGEFFLHGTAAPSAEAGA
jgi:demethylmenaquinone methyltransferase/2-methoxy-6-polyprenyl-1,4-benzoquinol methylase